jgi:hypothetical protein
MSSYAITAGVNIDSLTRLGLATGLAWTRSGTTVSVTQTAHGLAANDLVNVTNSSATTPVPNGLKTISVTNANVWTFTGVNSGAASGTLDAEHLDDFLINGGTLTVDQDSRYGTNANTRSIMNDIVMSATLGGTIEFNASKVRLIPYDGASGNVPAAGTTIAGAAGSGLLIGVYADLASAPTAAGNAMPAAGFIKIKQWNDAAYVDNEALSGLTANVNGTDRVGWIEIVGANVGLATVSRLNTFRVRGDWFEVGTTDGTRATTYQIPSNGSAVFYFPGVWVETGAATEVYEFYPMAGVQTALLANIATDAVKGKVCWISLAGLLRFGHDGTNSTGGYCPPTGLRIRVPNVFFMNCLQTALTANVIPNATLATRHDFNTAGGGLIDIRHASMMWYPIFAQAFDVTIQDTCVLTQLALSEIASPLTLSNIGVGLEATTANPQAALSITVCFAGGTVSDVTLAVASLAASGRYIYTFSDIEDFTFNNLKTISLTNTRGNATSGAASITRAVQCTWNDHVIGGGRLLLSTCTDCTFNDSIYFDGCATTTTTTNAQYMFDLSTKCDRLKIDGVSFLANMQGPYSGLMQVGAAGCSNIKLRNVGTLVSPLDLGDTRQDDVAWTRVTTTATVTKVAHGLKVNDIIYVIISSSIAAIVIGAKTVASVPTADTFTFTALNAGSASGTLSYYPTMTAGIFVLASGAAANTVELKRVYCTHSRTNLFTADNSSKNILLENVQTDYVLGASLFTFLNGRQKGLFAIPTLAAQTSVYGTHWVDFYLMDLPATTSGVSWTRSTTTATVTNSGHKLKTGGTIVVTVSSSTAAIILGVKSVTAVTADTFTFTCLNAGGASGTLTYQPLASRIGIVMNEATTDTTDQYEGIAGTAAFTSAGGLYMPAVNDEITFVLPYYVIGHTGFPIAEAVMAGGTIANYELTYAIDQNDGNGFSAFKNLYYPRTGAGGTNGQTTITMASTTGVSVDDYVWGTNVGPNAKVVSIDSGTNITVDNANIGTVSGTLRFSQLPSQAVTSAEDGFKLKIKIKTLAVNATAITSVYVWTLSTDTSRAYQYPLDLVPLTLTGLKNPTEVRVFNAGTTTEIAGQENVTSGTFTTEIDGGAYPDVDISILALGYQNTRLLNQTLGDGLSIPVSQVVDRQYLNP